VMDRCWMILCLCVHTTFCMYGTLCRRRQPLRCQLDERLWVWPGKDLDWSQDKVAGGLWKRSETMTRWSPDWISPFRLNDLQITFRVTVWLFFCGTKVLFTLYSYENKVSLDSR